MPVPRRQRRHTASAAPSFELLEERVLLSTSPLLLPSKILPSITYIAAPIVTAKVAANNPYAFRPIAIVKKNSLNLPASSPGPVGFVPNDIISAYGLNQVLFGNVTGDGTGQTIAIIDAYDDPDAFSDLTNFSTATGLPTLQLYNGTNTGAYFRRVNQSGNTTYPTTDPAGPGASAGTWEEEESLDIEWAHAVAPEANIMLVEANNPNTLFTAVTWATTQPGVSVVSMSFGGTESFSDTSDDSVFTTPSGHAGITFVAATGDDGAYTTGNSTKTVDYPAVSPNVVAVGGTSLTLSNDTYVSETAWSGSGGGISTIESKPTYQSSVTLSTNRRTIPDVSLDADPNTGVAVYDSYDFGTSDPWFQVGGTSLSTPLFAGIVAIADQGRALAGLSSLDGPSQTLPALYAAPASDFHDITTGSNGNINNPGYSAGPGYDLVTGIGSPIAQLLIPTLASVGTISGTVYQDNNGDGSLDTGDTPIAGATVFIDSNGNGVLDDSATTTSVSSTNVPLAIPDDRNSGVTSSLTVSGLTAAITNLTITFSITHPDDSDLIGTLTAPNGTVITLFSHVGGLNANFTNTTLSSSGSLSITGGSAPFTGTFTPSPGSLASFIGDSPDGTWKFKVADTSRGGTGTLTAWSLAITSGVNEVSTTTDANGNYSFDLPNGTYDIREIAPATDLPTTPVASNVTVADNNTTLNFGNFPTLFNATGPNDSFYLTLNPNDTSKLQIYDGTSAIGSPAYTIALNFFSALAPSLTFSLQGANSILAIDYSNGSPIPGSSITVNGVYNTNQQLIVNGGDPNNQFTMTDYQLGLNNASPILFNTLPTLTLSNGTYNYSGSLDTLQNLNINSGSTFIWN